MEPIEKSLSTYRPESSQTLTKPLSAQAVAVIFDSLKGQLGGKVADLWNGTAPNLIEQEWSRALAGFRRHELQRGIDACATRVFAPTLGEFAQMCRPCLNHEWAWLEAGEGLRARDDGAMGEWSHPAVYFAAIEMGPDVRAGDWHKSRTRWTRMLTRELAKGWREVPAPAMRVQNDAKVGPPPDEVRARLERLRRETRDTVARRAADEVLKGELE